VTPARGSTFWGTNGAHQRWEEETRVWSDNPNMGLVPILATVEAHVRKKWKPAGGVNVTYQLIKPDDIPAGDAVAAEPLRNTTTTKTTNNRNPPPPSWVFAMTGSPDKYVKDSKAQNPPVADDPLVDNVHSSKGGKRSNGVAGTDHKVNLFEITTSRPTFNDDLKLKVASASTRHGNAIEVVTNDEGKAAGLLMPSFTGGDRYKVRVYLDPVRDSDSDGTSDDAVVEETGTFVVWRILRISKYLRWDHPAASTPQQQARCGGVLDPFDVTGTIATEYKKAWLDVEVEDDAKTPTPITQADWLSAIRFAKGRAPATYAANVTQTYDLNALIPESSGGGVNNGSSGLIRYLTAAQYDAAPKAAPAPPGGWPTAAGDGNYWANMGQIFHALNYEFMQYFTRNAIGGLTIIQAGAMTSWVPDAALPAGQVTPWRNSGWGTPRRGCYVIFGHTVYFGGMPYDHTRNAMHETGHVLYGVHQYTDGTQVNVNTGGNFDGHDYHDLCMMGYMVNDGGFCGRCVLNQAGWDTGALAANNPGP
jgi:hypothetical protein